MAEITFSVAQRNAGVDYVKARMQDIEEKLSGIERAFIPRVTDAKILQEVDNFLAAVTRVN